ncbi:hypothetical protein NQ317_004120, partial [Molorchus minor]
MSDPQRKAIIIGGGLVGSLCACFMARRGYKVVVFEKREDIRKFPEKRGRSINLSLSDRGRAALRLVGLEEVVLKASIAMRGRLLHGVDGTTKSVLYDPVKNQVNDKYLSPYRYINLKTPIEADYPQVFIGDAILKNNAYFSRFCNNPYYFNLQCIYSVGRNFLNQILLAAAETYPNVSLYFNHKLIRSNINEGNVTVLNTETYETFEDTADLIIGADGAFSALRRSLQQCHLFNYSQNYIEHGYLELSIPAKRNDQMVPNHLHIWPRGQFMMIALPNKDGSWTVTLFMPFQRFEELNCDEKVVQFFGVTFPDAVPLIGEQELTEQFFKRKPSALISIKATLHHFGSKFLIIGDAAHAMVPFYGQGMNAGFEDCIILNELLDKTEDIEEAIKEYSKVRIEDAHAICDLAMYNYIEMRDLVTKPTFYLRKRLDNLLSGLFPDTWVPLYNSVCFSRMKYTKCIENRKWQDA